MDDVGTMSATSKTIRVVSRTLYSFDNLKAVTTQSILVAQHIDVEPFTEVDLVVRVHTKTIGALLPASITVQVFADGWTPEDPTNFAPGGATTVYGSATISLSTPAAPTMTVSPLTAGYGRFVAVVIKGQQPDTTTSVHATLSIDLVGKGGDPAAVTPTFNAFAGYLAEATATAPDACDATLMPFGNALLGPSFCADRDAETPMTGDPQAAMNAWLERPGVQQCSAVATRAQAAMDAWLEEPSAPCACAAGPTAAQAALDVWLEQSSVPCAAGLASPDAKAAPDEGLEPFGAYQTNGAVLGPNHVDRVGARESLMRAHGPLERGITVVRPRFGPRPKWSEICAQAHALRVKKRLRAGHANCVTLRVLPNAECHFVNASTPNGPSLVLMSDSSGIVSFECTPRRHGESVRMLARCTSTTGETLVYVITLSALADAQLLRPWIPDAPALPALSHGAPDMTADELLAAGYPSRPNAAHAPLAYARWLKLVSRPMISLTPERERMPTRRLRPPRYFRNANPGHAPPGAIPPTSVIVTQSYCGPQYRKSVYGAYLGMSSNWVLPEVAHGPDDTLGLQNAYHASFWLGLGGGAPPDSGGLWQAGSNSISTLVMGYTMPVVTHDVWSELVSASTTRPGEVKRCCPPRPGPKLAWMTGDEIGIDLWLSPTGTPAVGGLITNPTAVTGDDSTQFLGVAFTNFGPPGSNDPVVSQTVAFNAQQQLEIFGFDMDVAGMNGGSVEWILENNTPFGTHLAKFAPVTMSENYVMIDGGVGIVDLATLSPYLFQLTYLDNAHIWPKVEYRILARSQVTPGSTGGADVVFTWSDYG